MPPISEEIIEKVRLSHDIVDVISQYVSLRKSGKNYVGLCPFHSEKTPSFNVVPDKQFFYCFGCHKGGDLFKFLMEIEGISYVEAVEILADKAGIPLPQTLETTKTAEDEKRERMREAHLLAVKYYSYVLNHTQSGETAREYMKGRGILPKTSATFQIGFAPPGKEYLAKYLLKQGFAAEELVEAGLLWKGEDGSFRDRFIGRLMIPIEDLRGRIVGFSGRLIGEGKPKYLNTPETPIFHKGSLLFNYHRAKRGMKKSGQVLLMEGQMDVITAFQAGIENVVASLGTAFTEEMARLLQNIGQITLCYDGDNAGQESTERASSILEEHGLIVRVAMMRDGKDPDQYIRQYGGERFKAEILKESIPVTSFRLERLRKGINLNDPQDRSIYVEKAIAEISRIPNAIEKEEYVKQLSKEFQIPVDIIKQEMERWVKRNLRDEKRRDMSVNKWNNKLELSISSNEKRLQPAYMNAERRLIGWMLKHPEMIPRVMQEIGDAFNHPEHVAIIAELYAGYLHGEENLVTYILHHLSDPGLTSLVTEIVMKETDEPITDKSLTDLIDAVKEVPKASELKELLKERTIALETGDSAKARRLDMAIRERQKVFKRVLPRR